MVAAWMLYGAVVAALLAAGAAALDRALRARGHATRLAWAAAIAGSLLLPALALRHARAPEPVAQTPNVQPLDGAERERALALLRLLAAAQAQARDAVAPHAAWQALDRPLLAAWGAASVALLAWLALSHRTLARRRRAWQEAAVDDVRVLVAPDVGPAVVGLARAHVVLPAWALDADPAERALMLAHEREHLRVGDPLLIAVATAAAALAPWSPAVWWQLRRLRLAVEVDCDRRVLRRHPDVRAYGGLLLDVARRAHPAPRLAVAALASPVTSLERRIRIMTSRRTPRTALQATLLSAAAVALAVAACETPRPTAPRPEARPALTKIDAASAGAKVEGTMYPSEEVIRAAIARYQPDVLRSATGKLRRVWFVTDAAGNVVQSARDEDGSGRVTVPDRIDPATIATVDVRKFAAGRLAPDGVGAIWIVLKKGESSAPVHVRAEGTTMSGERVTQVTPSTVGVAGATVRTEPRARIGVAVPDTGATLGTTLQRPLRTIGTARGPAPLYLIDGREVPDAEVQRTLAALDRDSIETVDVFKGESALARFGERGRDGVVRIVTKSGARAVREY
jgi:beta-lactamase regulating signal transducer with metallopeptidase domain